MAALVAAKSQALPPLSAAGAPARQEPQGPAVICD